MLYLCNMQLVTQRYQLRAPYFFLGFGMINPSQTWLCKGLRISLKYYFHFILEIFLFTIWEWTRDDHTAFSTIISLKPRRKIWIHLHFLLNTYIPSLTQSFDTMQWSFLWHNLSTVTSIIISSFVILPTVEFLWVFFSHDVKSVCNGGILGEKQKRKTEQFMILLTCRNKNYEKMIMKTSPGHIVKVQKTVRKWENNNTDLCLLYLHKEALMNTREKN